MDKDVCLSWSSHGKVLSDGIWKLLVENYRTDLDLSLSGHHIKVHHVLLAIFCPLIKQVESGKYINGEDLAIDKEDLQHLMEFMYRGKVIVSQNRLPCLLKCAETLGFHSLLAVIKKYLLVQSRTESVRKRPKEGRLAARKALENLDTLTKSTKDESDDGNLASKVVEVPENSFSDVNDFYKERPNYRRTVDCSSFDPGSLQHICKHCNQGFDIFDDYVNHVRQHENPELTHKCPHCSYKAKRKFALVQHVVAKHEVDMHGRKLQRNLKCSSCSYTCFAKFQLQNHQYTAHAEKAFKCDQCNFGSTSRATFDKHVRFVHLNERSFMCETCGSRFKTFQAFRSHLTTHIGKKRVCEICGANLTVNSFQSHMKTHSEERPYPCRMCSFAARKKYNLKVHMKNVHKISIGQTELQVQQEVNVEEGREGANVKNEDLAEDLMEISAEFDYGVMTSASLIT